MLGTDVVVKGDVGKRTSIRRVGRRHTLAITEERDYDDEVVCWVERLVGSNKPFIVRDCYMILRTSSW